MKRLIGISLFLSLLFTVGYSQDEPIPPKRSRAMKVGLFGGFTPGWLFVDVKPINTFLIAAKGAPLKEDGMFMTGGGGAAYIMLLPNVRVGGMGMTGGLKSSSIDLNSIRRDAELRVGWGGLTIEYVMALAERLDVSVGAMFGGGGMDLTLRQSNGGSNTWVGEQELFGAWTTGTPGNTARVLSGTFFIWSPTLNVEYALLPWMAVRLGASYIGMSFPSWTVDAKHDLLGVPSEVSGKGFMMQLGVLVGTF